jgi:Na+-transporting methylmalonyl-CoA/oxaloacetate decarboxylase gamma subunit
MIETIANQGGFTVALVGYIIVFMALVVLIVIFNTIPRIINMKVRTELRRKGKEVTNQPDELSVGGDISAAISMALHLYLNDMHDEETNVITISRIQRRYSPWSSKIYNIYNTPLK